MRRSCPAPNLAESMSMNRKSGTTMSRTRSSTASADTEDFGYRTDCQYVFVGEPPEKCLLRLTSASSW